MFEWNECMKLNRRMKIAVRCCVTVVILVAVMEIH